MSKLIAILGEEEIRLIHPSERALRLGRFIDLTVALPEETDLIARYGERQDWVLRFEDRTQGFTLGTHWELQPDERISGDRVSKIGDLRRWARDRDSGTPMLAEWLSGSLHPVVGAEFESPGALIVELGEEIR